MSGVTADHAAPDEAVVGVAHRLGDGGRPVAKLGFAFRNPRRMRRKRTAPGVKRGSAVNAGDPRPRS
jgi:hypothetical protein